MLYYDWEKIDAAAKGNALTSWSIFYMLYNAGVPSSKQDPAYKHRRTNFSGLSFLVNPAELVKNQTTKNTKDLVVYLQLASYRSLAEYLAFNKVTLDLLHIPVNEEYYIYNSLLYIKDGSLHFLYEGNPKRKKKDGIIV